MTRPSPVISTTDVDLRCEVLIVGTGPVAATFARHLLERDPALSVLMVDAGGARSDPPGAHLRNDPVLRRDAQRYLAAAGAHLHRVSAPTARDATIRRLDERAHVASQADRPGNLNPAQDPRRNLPEAAVTYAIGGMGIVWTGLALRLHPALERSTLVPEDVWERLYARAEADLCAAPVRGSARQALILELLDEAGLDAAPAAVAARPADQEGEFGLHWIGPWDILAPVAASPGLRVLPNHLVQRLHCRAGAVRHAEVIDLATGTPRTIHAERFVVAGGGLLTPQLLWNSDIQRGDTALGRYLCDHPLARAQVVLGRDAIERLHRRAGAPGSAVQDPQEAQPTPPLPIDVTDPRPFAMVPLTPEHPYHGVLLDGGGDPDRLEGRLDDRLLVGLYWYTHVTPRPDNRLVFDARQRDLLGMPRPRFEYALSADEQARTQEMLAEMRRVGDILGAFLPFAPPRLMAPGSSMHIMGTTRMGGADDGTSVTDSFGRVWGLDNLYLGGTGLLETATATNPTLTAVALAIRSARHMSGRAA